MEITSLKISDFRSLKLMEPIQFNRINVLIGENNAGKSSLIKALHSMQDGAGLTYSDVRVGSSRSRIEIGLSGIGEKEPWARYRDVILSCLIELQSENRKTAQTHLKFITSDGSASVLADMRTLPNTEPDHFIIPFLSKRKTQAYQEDVRSQNLLQVAPNLSYLSSKLARISNAAYPWHKQYRDACEEILGFMVTAIPSDNGMRPGIYLPDGQSISIDQMGEGVPNIVGLLADLAISKGKLFLIEEPENDLHPAALKALLEFIIDSSESNQFVISTHSNIVLSQLGAIDSCNIFKVSSKGNSLPTESMVEAVGRSPSERLSVLRDLGYALSDFELWDGWLFLEESSAERIIRDYLIPWFAPKLSRVRTVSASGITNVSPTLEDFNRLVRFSHLETIYRESTWIRVDGDQPGLRTIEELRNRYQSWDVGRFSAFKEHAFERYYPEYFRARAEGVLSIADKQSRREQKKTLLNDVLNWLDEDEERGRAELGKSAAEIIQDLTMIQAEIMNR